MLISWQDIHLHPERQDSSRDCCSDQGLCSEICLTGKKVDCNHQSFLPQRVFETAGEKNNEAQLEFTSSVLKRNQRTQIFDH